MSLSGPETEQARQVAEAATGGTAGEVQRHNVESEAGGRGDEDGGSQQGYQSPANAAYEVEVAKAGNEIEVHLDSSFQILDTQAEDAE